MTCKLGERHGQPAGPVGAGLQRRGIWRALIRPLLEMLETVTGLESTYLTEIDLEQGTQHIRLPATWPGCRSRRGGGGVERYPVPPGHRRREALDDVAAHWGGIPQAAQAPHPHLSEQPGAHLVRSSMAPCVAPAPSANPGGGREQLIAFFARLIAEQVEPASNCCNSCSGPTTNCHARPVRSPRPACPIAGP